MEFGLRVARDNLSILDMPAHVDGLVLPGRALGKGISVLDRMIYLNMRAVRVEYPRRHNVLDVVRRFDPTIGL